MSTGQNITEWQKLNAWLKASVIQDYEHLAHHMRADAYGNIIVWKEYGQTTDFGWEIDHELPKVLFPALAQVSSNLRALHWKANRSKSDKIDLASILRSIEK